MIADRNVAARMCVCVCVCVVEGCGELGSDNILLGQLSKKTKQCLLMLTNKLTHLLSYCSSPVIISFLKISQEPLLCIRVMYICNFSDSSSLSSITSCCQHPGISLSLCGGRLPTILSCKHFSCGLCPEGNAIQHKEKQR